MNNKKLIGVKFDEKDLNVLKEIADEKRIPLSVYIRSVVVESKDFKDKVEELFKIELENIEQNSSFDRLSEMFKEE